MSIKIAFAIVLFAAFVAGPRSIFQPEFRRPRLNTKSPIATSPTLQDEIWAVVEMPEGQELTLELVPGMAQAAKGTARVSRTSNGTEINLEVSGVSGDGQSYHAFAIDSLGNASALGTLTVSDGAGTLRAQSALTTFMIVVSTRDDVVTLATDTPIVLRSKAPDGYKIVPRAGVPEVSNESKSTANQTDSPALPEYDVPLLGVASLKRASPTQMTAKRFESLRDNWINVSLTPRKKGVTQVTLIIRDLKPSPDGRRYVVWLVSDDKAYLALGTANPGKQAKVDGLAEFNDFGIFITLEESESPPIPTGKMVAMIVR
jgi:hypothetical protein